jgi:hypothetical protein
VVEKEDLLTLMEPLVDLVVVPDILLEKLEEQEILHQHHHHKETLEEILQQIQHLEVEVVLLNLEVLEDQLQEE